MKEPEKILEAKDICKAYGKNMVLNQVNLTIKAGYYRTNKADFR